MSLFWNVAGRDCEGSELVGPGSWQLVDSVIQFSWRLMHFSRFHWLLQVEAFGPVLHFWWNPFVHTLHFTGAVLEHKAELLASAREKPWFKRDFNDGVVGLGGEVWGWVGECPLADGEKCRWQSQVRVKRTRALVVCLQGGRHYRRMNLHDGKLGRHTDGE